MAVQRIDIPAKHTHGWQARWHVTAGQRLTAFFADAQCGGKRAAKRCAQAAEPGLKRRAIRMRGAR